MATPGQDQVTTQITDTVVTQPPADTRLDMTQALETMRRARQATPTGTTTEKSVQERGSDSPAASESADDFRILRDEDLAGVSEDRQATIADQTPDSTQTEDDDPVVFQLDDGTPVKRSEAKSGHLRQSQFTKRTQEIAEKERALAARAAEIDEFKKVREAYSEFLADQAKKLEQEKPKLPDASLMDTDPEEYHRQVSSYLIRQEQAKVVRDEQERIAKEKAEEQAKESTERLRREADLALEKVETLRNAKPEDRPKVFRAYQKVFVAAGFDEKMFGQVTDHRFIRLLDLAAKGFEVEQIRSKSPSGASAAPIKANGSRPAPTLKSGSSGRNSALSPIEAELKAAESQFAKTGSMDDARRLRAVQRRFEQSKQT